MNSLAHVGAALWTSDVTPSGYFASVHDEMIYHDDGAVTSRYRWRVNFITNGGPYDQTITEETDWAGSYEVAVITARRVMRDIP